MELQTRGRQWWGKRMGLTAGSLPSFGGTLVPCPRPSFSTHLMSISEDHCVLEWPVWGLVKDREGSQSSEPPPRT